MRHTGGIFMPQSTNAGPLARRAGCRTRAGGEDRRSRWLWLRRRRGSDAASIEHAEQAAAQDDVEIAQPSRRLWSGVSVSYSGCHASESRSTSAALWPRASARRRKKSTGLRSRKISIALRSRNSPIRASRLARRAWRPAALERVASSTAGQNFSSLVTASCIPVLTVARLTMQKARQSEPWRACI